MAIKDLGITDILPFHEQLQESLGGENSRRLLAIVTFAPLILFFVTIWFLPILYSLGLSFFERSVLSTDMTWIGFGNYASLLADGEFWFALWNGAVYAVSTTSLSILLGLGFALLVNKPFFGQRLTRTMMMLPYMVPSVVTIALWQWILAPSGIVNHYLQLVGLTETNIEFFSSVTWAMPSLVIASTWIYTAFAFFTILARLQSIPDSYYERAKVEGATQLQMFRDITLPNLRGVILLVALVRGIFLFNKFDIIFVATKGGPLGATTTLPIMIYEVVFMNYSLGRGTALAGILFVILAAGAAVYFRVFQPSKEVGA